MNMKQNLMHPNDMPIMQGHIKLSSTWCTLGNGCVTFNSLMHHRNYSILETSHMSLSGKTAPKTNLTLLPEFDLCAGKPRDGASWLLEVYHWATKRLAPRDSTKSHTWNLCQKPNTYNWTKLHYNSTACTLISVPPQREGTCHELFWTYESSKCTGVYGVKITRYQFLFRRRPRRPRQPGS